jgi:hypothetical protein
MANRNFNRFQALEKEVKELFLDVAIGASGAPTLTKGLGIASISRNSAGDYKITLDDKYTRLMKFECVNLVSSAEDLVFQLKSESVNSSKEVDFFCNAAAVATDPSNGSRLLISIKVKNSSVGE